MSVSTPYKPSPLAFNSPRASPFRRPGSPASPSPLRNSSTPTPIASPVRSAVTPGTSRLARAETPASDSSSWIASEASPITPREGEASPTRTSRTSSEFGPMMGATRTVVAGLRVPESNVMGKLPQSQVRELREGFGILDRDSDGIVGGEDIADMLNQLGLPSSAQNVASFFTPGQPQTATLPAFLTSISNLLSTLSPSSELLTAFSAFDDDDSGQIDIAELRSALLGTPPDPDVGALTEREVDRVVNGFSGRRAFAKNTGLGKRGEVFKYGEFVAAVGGNGNEKETEEKA